MKDPFQNAQKEKALENMVSPIKSHGPNSNDSILEDDRNVQRRRMFSTVKWDTVFFYEIVATIRCSPSLQRVRRLPFELRAFPLSRMRNGENCIYPLVVFTGSVNSVLNQNGSADTSVSSFADNHCNDTSDAALLGDSVLEEDSCCYFCHGRGDLVRCTGGCGRWFHSRCIDKGIPSHPVKWKCPTCCGGDLQPSDIFRSHCLKEWYFKPSSDSSAPLLLEGFNDLNGEIYKCPPLSSLLDPTHVMTKSGSIYVLQVPLFSLSQH